MKKIDIYILKRYLLTILTLVSLFIPIGVLIDLSEKIDYISRSNASKSEIINYYISFSIYFADLLIPIFLFISIIWFTSKLAQNSEIIAILSSGVSFLRLLRPYFIGAFIVGIVVFFMEMFVVPKASNFYQNFSYKYIYKGEKPQKTSEIFTRVSDSEYIYVSNYQPQKAMAYNFTLECFSGEKLKYKISADRIYWLDTLGIYRMKGYQKRTIGILDDKLDLQREKDTIFPFKIEDFAPASYIAETKTILELNNFIKKERLRGSSNINRYLLVAYKRWVFPITVLILTLIAVAVASKKKRGGLGLNLSFGMLVAFVYVFFNRVFGVMVVNSSFSPLLAVIIPNLIFGAVSFYMIRNARR